MCASELLERKCRLEHQWVTTRVEKGSYQVRDVESTGDVSDAKPELHNPKEALPVLEGRAAEVTSAFRSAVEKRDCPQDQLEISSAKLQILERAITAPFGHFMLHASNVQAANAVEQTRLKSFRSYMPTVIDQGKRSAKAYRVNVEGDILSLLTALIQNVCGMCTSISKHLGSGRQQVSDSGEGLSLQ